MRDVRHPTDTSSLVKPSSRRLLPAEQGSSALPWAASSHVLRPAETVPAIERPKAQYAQIADLLRERIVAGEYPPGAALPSEPALSAELGVSRVTVNKAVTLLRNAGLVRVHRGRGTFVRTVPPILRAAQEYFGGRERGSGAYDVKVRAMGFEPVRELAIERDVTPPPTVAELLSLGSGDTVLARRRRMLASGEPTELATTYVPTEISTGSALEQEDTGRGGTYARLAEMGHRIVRFTEKVTVRGASEAEARELEIDPDAPVFRILHATWTAAGTCPAVTLYVMPGQQWELLYEWNDITRGEDR